MTWRALSVRGYEACPFILHIVHPRFLSYMKSHDVASIICPALNRGFNRF